MSLILIAVFYHAQYYAESKVASSGVRDHAYAVLFLSALVLYFLLAANVILLIISASRLFRKSTLAGGKAHILINACVNLLSLFILFLPKWLYFKM